MTFRVEYTYKVSEDADGLESDPGAEDLFCYILEVFLLGPICIFGILANLLTIMVLNRKEMQSTVNCLLFALAVCDILFLSAQGIIFPFYNFCKFFGILAKYRYHYDPLLTPAYNWAAVAGQTGSIYFTLAITIERFIVVKYPLHAKQILTMKRARGISVFIITISVLFGLPHFYGIGSMPKLNSGNDTSVEYISYNYKYTDFGNGVFYTQYIAWGQTLFQFILPFIVLAMLNSFIAMKVRRAQQARSTFTASQQAEVSVSKMLLCVVAVFGICNSMLLVDSVISLVIACTDISPLNSQNLFFIRSKMWCILELLCGVNSASNFVIYCVIGNRFRASLCQMLQEFRDWYTCSGFNSRNNAPGNRAWRPQVSNSSISNSTRNKRLNVSQTTSSEV